MRAVKKVGEHTLWFFAPQLPHWSLSTAKSGRGTSSLFGNHVAIKASAISSVVALVVSGFHVTTPLSSIIGICNGHEDKRENLEREDKHWPFHAHPLLENVRIHTLVVFLVANVGELQPSGHVRVVIPIVNGTGEAG